MYTPNQFTSQHNPAYLAGESQARLSNKAMLVSLSISVWTAKKHDKKITREVALAHNTTEQAGRYNKNLLPFDSPSYKAVVQAATAARSEHYTQTLAWSDEGARILPASNYVKYTDAMRGHRAAFETAYQQFQREYPYLKTNAQQILNGLYREEDYPTCGELSRKFGFSMKILPLPEGGDFRVDLGAEEIAEIQRQIEESTHLAVSDAMRDLWDRLYQGVSHMAERLSNPDAIFRDSLFKNLEELCDLLPRLNLTGDAKLQQMTQEIRIKLVGYDPQMMREDKSARAHIAERAEQIRNDLAAFMGV